MDGWSCSFSFVKSPSINLQLLQDHYGLGFRVYLPSGIGSETLCAKRPFLNSIYTSPRCHMFRVETMWYRLDCILKDDNTFNISFNIFVRYVYRCQFLCMKEIPAEGDCH